MPSLVNRVPPGLLSLLGTKAMGINPSVLPDELVPSLELLPFYSAAYPEQVMATPTVTGPGPFSNNSVLAVPAGEMWLIEGLSITTDAVLVAGTTLKLGPVQYNSVGYVRIWPQDTYAPGERVGISTNVDRFLVPAGHTVGCWCAAFAGTSTVIRIAATFTRLVV